MQQENTDNMLSEGRVQQILWWTYIHTYIYITLFFKYKNGARFQVLLVIN